MNYQHFVVVFKKTFSCPQARRWDKIIEYKLRALSLALFLQKKRSCLIRVQNLRSESSAFTFYVILLTSSTYTLHTSFFSITREKCFLLVVIQFIHMQKGLQFLHWIYAQNSLWQGQFINSWQMYMAMDFFRCREVFPF